MVHHGFCPPTFICVNIIPISKGAKANLSDSDKYRSLAICSQLTWENTGPYYYSQTI